MLVIRTSDGHIYASGPQGTCSILESKISAPGIDIFYNALAENGIAPTASDFSTVTTDDVPVGHFALGHNHKWDGSAIIDVPGYVPPPPPDENGEPVP